MNIDRMRRNLEEVHQRIAAAARRSRRPVEAIRLVAVTKLSPPEWIGALVALGVHDLGENYPQELCKKSAALADRAPGVRWHLIGHLQSNKVKKTLPLVRMIHSVDSLKLLRAVNNTAPAMSEPPSVCLQVNTSGEQTKHGWTPEQILKDAEAIASCRSIPIVGLMTMAAVGSTDESARRSFNRLSELRDTLRNQTGLGLVELSMGMSGDFESAIEEGATLLRIGSAIFQGVGE
jgi:pyridoxal phosphate enzyme (YggS family)